MKLKLIRKNGNCSEGSLLMITAGEASGSEPVKIERREAAMLYNYYFIIVLILLLPVTLNIILPLIMLAVWLLRQLVFGSRK